MEPALSSATSMQPGNRACSPAVSVLKNSAACQPLGQWYSALPMASTRRPSHRHTCSQNAAELSRKLRTGGLARSKFRLPQSLGPDSNKGAPSKQARRSASGAKWTGTKSISTAMPAACRASTSAAKPANPPMRWVGAKYPHPW